MPASPLDVADGRITEPSDPLGLTTIAASGAAAQRQTGPHSLSATYPPHLARVGSVGDGRARAASGTRLNGRSFVNDLEVARLQHIKVMRVIDVRRVRCIGGC